MKRITIKEENPLYTAYRLPQEILASLVTNLTQLEARHSDVAHVNCKIVDILVRQRRSDDWYEVDGWYWLSQKINVCQQAIGQMRQSGRLDVNTIQNVSNIIRVLRVDWGRYHQTIVEKYHRLNPTINTNPSREGIAILNRIMTQLEKLNRFVQDRSPVNWFWF